MPIRDQRQRATPGEQGPSEADIADAREVTGDLAGGSAMGSSAAAALGSAMLGLDQAIRREPPAQIVAAEHQPERDPSGDESTRLIIQIPSPGEPPHEPAERPSDASREPGASDASAD